MKTTLSSADTDSIFSSLATANAETARQYPVGSGARQPVHTVYGGAHIFKAAGARKLGDIALKALETYGGGAVDFAKVLGLDDPGLAEKVYGRVVDKLKREPVEDFRIDFEDGYGNRPDEEEDGHAVSSAGEVVKGLADGTLPPFIGIRIKTLSDELCRRSLRTLDLFVTSLLDGTGGTLPPNFVVTLPKIVNQGQVKALVAAFQALEKKHKLPERSLLMEFMVETPQSVLAPDGSCALPALLHAADGRCRGAHMGTYDYTALCDITAEYQEMTHAVCDFAKHMMQVSLLNRDIMLSDGATNVMPVAVHRGTDLNENQKAENAKSVRDGWALHASHINHSLVNGYYQGWDLHPAQLPTRYGAVYAFFLKSFDSAATRLKHFVEAAAKATLVGDVFDDAATGQGLLNYFLRGMNCGAFSEEEAMTTGLTMAEFQTRSFLKILEGRKG